MKSCARNAGNTQIIYAKLKARGRRGRPGGSEMRPIILTKVKRNQFSKELEREWISCKSLEEVHDNLQEIHGNIEEIKVEYWVKED